MILLRCLLAFVLLAHPAWAKLTKEQMDKAARVEVVTVPTPSEFFAAINKAGKPDWASFYREPIPTAYPARSQIALNLGTLVADGFIAVEAQDGQQVKNIGKDIIALAKSLGVGADVLGRGKSISDFADNNDWAALNEEIEATTNDVRLAMADQRDVALATLITTGAWLRGVQVGSRAVERSGDPEAAELLRQPALAAYLRGELAKLPEKTRGEPLLMRVDETLLKTEKLVDVPPGEPMDPARVAELQEVVGTMVLEMSAKAP